MMPDESNADGLRQKLRHTLGAAMKARDVTAVSAFRSVVAAIDDAEAADLSDAPAMQNGAIAGGVAGLGAGEVPRRGLSDAQFADLGREQVAAWRNAAADYERSGHHDHATRLAAEAAIVAAFLANHDT